ncbi:MAG: hypothetical protein Q8Q31_05225 [Nanoarchaeota archaeon]|nr:hypothetical protein [Nanoarchaeota archaeon]
MRFYNLVQRVRHTRESIDFTEVLNLCPESCKKDVARLGREMHFNDVVYLLAVTDFYNGTEEAFKTILKSTPKRVAAVEDDKGMMHVPSCGAFYITQKQLYQTRISRGTPSSLTALEVGLQTAFNAETEAPHFGSHRNIGHFGQSEGRIYQTS